MLNFWITIILDVIGFATGIFLIAAIVRMDRNERIRFFLGPKCFWPLYLGVVAATFGWASVLVEFRKGHWSWQVFQTTAVLVVFVYVLTMWIKTRHDHQPNSTPIADGASEV